MASFRLKLKAIGAFVREVRRNRRQLRAEPSMQSGNCHACGRTVDVFFDPGHDVVEQNWTCPYTTCRAINRNGITGWIVRVAAGEEPVR
jgi:hypothetical protein